MLKLRDADTGESELNVKKVEAGLCLELGYTKGVEITVDHLEAEYITLILDRQGEDELFRFLLRRQQDIANRFLESL